LLVVANSAAAGVESFPDFRAVAENFAELAAVNFLDFLVVENFAVDIRRENFVVVVGVHIHFGVLCQADSS